jgi:hypothetical protein
MKIIEKVIRNHNKQLYVHFRLVMKNKAPEENLKITNETIREIEGWKDQVMEIEMRDRYIKLLQFMNTELQLGISDIHLQSKIDKFQLQ